MCFLALVCSLREAVVTAYDLYFRRAIKLHSVRRIPNIVVTLFHSPTDEPPLKRLFGNQDETNSARYQNQCIRVDQHLHLQDRTMDPFGANHAE